MLDFLIHNDFLSSIIAFVVVLIPAVIIHEFGHFLAAKVVGITVLEFGIGFPPRITRLFNWGETEFTLNWLPFGGFVRPLGEDMIRPLSEEEVQRDREKLLDKMAAAAASSDAERETLPTPLVYISEREELAARGIVAVRSINDVKPLPRIFFMAAGALANFLSALVIFVIIGLLGIPQPSGARVELREIDPNSALATAGFQAGDYVETLNGAKFSGSREFFQLLAAESGKEVTVTLRRKDVDNPITLQFTPDATEANDLAQANGVLLVASVQETSPAFTTGIQPGDTILTFAGEDLTSAQDPFGELQKLSQIYEGKTTQITYQRDDQVLNGDIVPRVNPPSGVGRIGIGLDPQFAAVETGILYADGPMQQDYVPLAPGSAITYGLERTGEIIQSIAEFPARLLRRETQPEENRIISIVGVSQIGGAFLQESIQENRPAVILNYIALISIALGVTNLFPIPALDGGRIVFVLLEMVRGKPLSPEREGVIHLIGLAFLLSIGIIFILNDFFNPLTNLLP